jgi:hypothetical protein
VSELDLSTAALVSGPRYSRRRAVWPATPAAVAPSHMEHMVGGRRSASPDFGVKCAETLSRLLLPPIENKGQTILY